MPMGDLIYNQRKIPREQWRYGFRSSAATGCGWIATYNALCLLGRNPDPQKLIRAYERQLPLIHGNTGTSFWGPALMFKKWGYCVTMTAKQERYDDLCRRSDVCLLFYHWRQGWRIGAHFVAVHFRDGAFIGYNTTRSSTGPDHYGSSLKDYIRRRKLFGTVLIGIQNKT